MDVKQKFFYDWLDDTKKLQSNFTIGLWLFSIVLLIVRVLKE